MNDLTMLQFITAVNKSDIKQRLIPTELSSGWPSISIKNRQICITVPYFRTQPGQEGKVLLFPISYSLTLVWSNGAVVDFTRYSFTKEFKELDYSKPVGTFKHDGIQDMNKQTYVSERNRLFSYYDELISCIIEKKEFIHGNEIRELLGTLIEPSLLPMYKKISPKFFESYCK